MGTKENLTGIPLRLQKAGLISEKLALEAVHETDDSRFKFLQYVADSAPEASGKIASKLGRDFGLCVFDLNEINYKSIPREAANEGLVAKHNALPVFKRGSKLFLATADPTNTAAVDDFKFTTGLNAELVIVEANKLPEAIAQAKKALMSSLSEDNIEFADAGEDDNEGTGIDPTADVEDAPVVKYVNKILLDAINQGASDIHVEPYEKIFRVRYRIDGILQEVAQPPKSLSQAMTARLKVMSSMDISERRVPQDGRIKLKMGGGKSIDFRVNTCPTLFGEKTVLRILDSDSAMLGIEVLGYEEEQKNAYLSALANPYGMILVTGPTGSGKTVSLYTGLNILNEPETNISTAEDPAEINLPGINQVNMNPKAGLTFSEALKSFLRQDPDVIMVGEIRDLETAGIAIKAAQTGHLVLSTLHTNDAPQTLSRLVNMGIAPFNIASAVTLIIAQRLARRLCSNCKEPQDLPKEVLLHAGYTEEEIGTFQPMHAKGCGKCTNGSKGRVGIYQVLPMSEELGRIVMEGGNALDIADQAAKEGIQDLRGNALKKVKDGLISLAEAERVTLD